MHKTAERPIEVRRVIFSEVPTLYDDQTHNTRSVSRVTDISRTESTDSAQPNGLGSDHPTSTLGATSPIIPRRSERLSQPPERYSPRIFFIDAGESTSYEEESAVSDSATWHLAMESEMHSIRANKTWDLVELPKNRRALPCKWVYRLKEKSESTTPKYKARLVAKGFRQEYGVDFDEIFHQW